MKKREEKQRFHSFLCNSEHMDPCFTTLLHCNCDHHIILIWKWCFSSNIFHFFNGITSRWREETVEIEREGVELLITAVTLKCPKFNPPWHSSISGTFLVVKCVVQENCNNQCNSWGWEEDSIKEIIELHIK